MSDQSQKPDSLDIQTQLACAIARSFWMMAGGGEDSDSVFIPSSGDLQIAYDILQSPVMQEIRKCLHGTFTSYSDQPLTDDNMDDARVELSEPVVQWIIDP